MLQSRQQHLLSTASRLRELGRIPDAITAYRTLLAEFPDLPDSWYNLGWLLRQAGHPVDALTAYGEALKRGISGPEEVHLNRAAIYSDSLARPEEAEAELQTALSLNPAYLPAWINLANLHEDLGRKADAKATYERGLAIAPENAILLSRYAGLGRADTADDPVIIRIRALLDSGKLQPADRPQLLYALGRLYDTCGAYEAATSSFEEANRSARAAAAGRMMPYSAEADLRRVELLAEHFPKPAHRTGGILSPRPQPVFILGMFRSGSTLLEQILGAHSSILAGGELDIVPRIAERLGGQPDRIAAAPEASLLGYAEAYLKHVRNMFPEATLVTDKRPDNFWHIGLIKRLFPEAKILHTIRNPLDTLISIWGLYLDPSMNYGFRVEDIAAHIHAERQMMAHWKTLYPEDILSVGYEDMIQAPGTEIKRVLDFLNLPFEPQCLDFHTARSHVRTASVWQVREPFHARSVGRWRHYEPYLRGLASDPALKALLAVEPPAKPS